MRLIWRFLGNWLVSTFLAVLIVSLIVFFVGDLLALGDWRPLESLTIRIIIVVVLAVLWLLALGLWLWRRHRRNKDTVEEIVEAAPDPTAEALSAEEGEVQSKFSSALRDLAKLRFKSRFGGTRYLYELPWYIFIGPPGAGKTTALEKCGLEFPLRRSAERVAIRDTRNIEWIFTNEAVFIDTAGRYTTQDSNTTIDKGAWDKLLDLIVRRRPGEPVNGIFVAISISELATADTETIDAHAEAVRDRLAEICEKMRARVPVYLMFTKVDLLVGFNEFFQSLRREEREQVWGVTYPLKGGMASRDRIARDLGSFSEDFDLLVGRLGEMQFPLLQEEPDIDTRAKIFGFASQFSSLRPVIDRFLQQTFRPDKWTEAILLRGFYFTSATQVGQPVDRLISTMAREFGLAERVINPLVGDSTRSYFLGGLLRNVIFPEAGLVATAKKARRALLAMRYGVAAVCVVVPVLFGLGWWTVEQHMKSETESLTGVLAEYEADVAALDLTPVADSDFRATTRPLNRLRDEFARLESDEADEPFYGLAIADMDDLRRQAELAYHQGLEDLLRPRLLYRLENALGDNQHRPGHLYDVLKAYLMVGGRGPMDETYIQSFMAVDWEEPYPANLNADLRADLDSHLDVLLTLDPPPDLKLNEEAISVARTIAGKISLAERAYRILKTHPDVVSLRPWQLTDAADEAARQTFIRASGVDLDAPIDGLFTYRGFWSRFVPNADTIVEAALEEKWVLEPSPGDGVPDSQEITATRQEIRDLYYDEYIEVWSGLLADLRIVPFRDAAQASEVLNLLSSRRSPLKRVLQAVVYNTQLAEQPAEDSEIANEAGQIAFHRFSSRFRTAARLLEAGARQQKQEGVVEGQPVQDEFDDLRQFVGGDGREGDFAQVMDQLERLYTTVDDMAKSRGSDISVLSETESAVRLGRLATRAPRNLREMLDQMLTQADAATVGGIKAKLNEIWRSTIAPVCRERIHGRYPFGSGPEVPFDDLTAVLGPDGLIDDFYQKRLASMVDDTVSPWRWKGSIGASLGIPNSELEFFEKASQLREAFFPGGRPRPAMAFDLSVYGWDPEVTVARFALGGIEAPFLRDEEAGAKSYQMEWPGVQPGAGAEVGVALQTTSLQFEGLAVPGQEQRLGEPGPWGLFKLIGKSYFDTRRAPDIVRVLVDVEGGKLFLQMKMRSANNPLRLRKAVRSFRCPPGF
ncbi:MAG: type VI secretion system membrane subunit TssM [Paracoccaceae bacterium]